MRPCPFQGLWGRIPQCGLAQTTWSKLGCGAPAGPSLGLCPSPKHRAGSRDRCRALPWARGPGCPGGCGGAASPWLRHPGAMPEGAGPGSLQGGHAPARRQGAPQRGRGGGGLLALPLGAACRSVMTPSAGARLPGQQRWSRSWSGCAGRRRRCSYLSRGLKHLSGARKKNGMKVHPIAPQKLTVSARWQKPTHLPCVIHVFRNGDLLSPPFRLLLSKSTLLEWDAVLGLVTEKASLRSGAVRRLCRLDGVAVSSGEELVNGGYYVAVGAEKYKNLPYFELLVPENSAQRVFWSHPNNRRGIHNKGFSKFHATSQDGASDSALLEPPQQLDSRRVQSTGAAEKDETPVPSLMVCRPARRYPHREEESVFHAKPARAGQNKKSHRNTPHWLDQEEGGVYKVKDPRKELRGAREVAEDEHTMVELPVDQSAAETVEEEVLPKNRPTPQTKAGTTRRSQKALTTRNNSSDSEAEAN
ncbi:doublecortin domain-containing protein 2B isoform X1 [Alligator mississippiensis]|uniref:doublecortin domain-containing protein 2B isoform X1 n=1 Tax=Alligator mississippiensis TaxID=8496 RepID=UPI0028776B06|nr:doublecortin domain-containing protein 2B isoform X1 [Alligator mississippiensis]